MNVNITTFRNPFSFFCMLEDAATNVESIVLPENICGQQISNKLNTSDVNHGQYVAVLWNNAWTRGIISWETQCQIWLIDYGIYLRLYENLVYVDLPADYKKNPTKVFEASIHGVTPIKKVINGMCDIKNATSTTWCSGAIEKTQELLAEAIKTHFVPIAMLCTKTNDIVIGDLYLQIKGRGLVNLADELEKKPFFLEKNPKLYIDNLLKFYKYRRQHRACLKKPVFPNLDLPIVTLQTTLSDYTAICASAPQLDVSDCVNSDEEGSTVTYIESARNNNKAAFKLTPAEIEKYSNFYITVSGREYNVLNLLLNKARDLYMCEQFKNLKSVGRATLWNSRSNSRNSSVE